MNSTVPSGPHLLGGLAGQVQHQPQMLVDLAAGSREVEIGQARVVRASSGDHHVVDRCRKVLEEPREAVGVGGVEGGAAQGAELVGGVPQPVGIAAGGDDLGPFGARAAGGSRPIPALPPMSTTVCPSRVGSRCMVEMVVAVVMVAPFLSISPRPARALR
jgi:hypothetical protein